MNHLIITPRDPLIARDGRPFSAGGGNRMRPLPFLYPSVVAGSLRTYLGKLRDPSFPDSLITSLRGTKIHGPLLTNQVQLFFPRPLDAVFPRDFSQVLRLRPFALGEGAGTDLPAAAGSIVGFDAEPEDGFKPGKPPDFWSLAVMEKWLVEGALKTFPIVSEDQLKQERLLQGSLSGDSELKAAVLMRQGYLAALAHDVRWHAQINDETYSAEDERLFLTSALAFPEGIALAARFSTVDGLSFSDGLSPLGGERRLAHWKSGGESLWKCPAEVERAVAGSDRVRLVLATPGLFRDGWIPGWLADGKPAPGTDAVFKLCGVCIDRWRAISGYSLDGSEGGRRYGRKPVRRLVPAGAVYFLQHVKGSLPVASRWLKPVSDVDEDIHRGEADGFGLALWGTW